MDHASSWPSLNKIFGGKTGGFGKDWGLTGRNYLPDGFAKMSG